MTSLRLREIEDLFHAALECDSGELGAFLDSACGDDERLRRRLEGLLASHRDGADFIEASPATLAARLIDSEAAGSPIGRTLGHYKVIEHVGSGGMGEVYLAIDTLAERRAVVKLLPPVFVKEAERLKRFRQEARAVVALNHPNIVTIYEIGEDDSTSYIASELIEGETLRQRMKRGPITLEQVVEIAVQIASALAAAHQAGIIHRDIKPENIMLRHDGYVKVLDFGIAKLVQAEEPASMPSQQSGLHQRTEFGSTVGTLRYMSPEQLRGEPANQRTDIWGLGVLLYELMSGATPFSGHTPEELIESIKGKSLAARRNGRSNIPAPLEAIIQKALDRRPDSRFVDMNAMLESLRELRRVLSSKRDWPIRRRHVFKWTWAATATAILSVGAAAALFLWQERGQANSASRVIAILPFDPDPSGGADSYFVQGIREEIIGRLARVEGFTVITVPDSQRTYGRQDELAARGKQRGAPNLLHGSVHRTGERIQIVAELTESAQSKTIWKQKFDRPLNDLIELERAIIAGIAAKLGVRLSDNVHGPLAALSPHNFQAHDLYLRGRDFARRNKLEELKEAIELYEQAIAKDRNYGAAYAALAEAYILLATQGNEMPPQHCFALARTAAEKALSCDPSLPEAHISLALALRYQDRDFARAQEELERAIRLAPSLARSHRYLACNVYAPQGAFNRAIPEMRRAVELEPLSAYARDRLGMCYLLARQYTQAVTELKKAIAIDPQSARACHDLATALLLSGRVEEAIRIWEDAHDVAGDDDSLAGLTFAYAVKGDRVRATHLSQQLEQTNQQRSRSWLLNRALANLAFGNKKRALQWLERGVTEDDPNLADVVKVMPLLDPLRDDPGFVRLVSELIPESASRPARSRSYNQATAAESRPRFMSPVHYGGNLLVNGAAEEGAASRTGARINVPGWMTTGELTVVPYGAPEGYPGASEVPPGGGKQFFAGGHSPVSSAVQEIDVSNAAVQIDAGRVICKISGWLAGYCDQTDDARFTIHFQDAGAGELESMTIGPVTALERANKTAFKFRSNSTVVPSGTRRIQAVLWLTRKSNAGLVNDGYADNLSVTLNGSADGSSAEMSD